MKIIIDSETEIIHFKESGKFFYVKRTSEIIHQLQKICNDIEKIEEEKEKLQKVVTAFAKAMLVKLHNKVEEGYKGWDSETYKEDIKVCLKQHVEKGDPVDIANFCMMLWNLENE